MTTGPALEGIPAPRRLLIAACALAVASLGLPWGVSAPGLSFGAPAGAPARTGPLGGSDAATVLIGGQHPVRVIGLIAALLLVDAVRRGRQRQARIALLVGALALPLGLGSGLTSGPIAYAAALLLAAVGAGVSLGAGSPAAASMGPPGVGLPGVGRPAAPASDPATAGPGTDGSAAGRATP